MKLGPQMLGWTTQKGLIFNTGPYAPPPPLKNQNFEKREDQAQGKIFMNLGPQMADIGVDKGKGVTF